MLDAQGFDQYQQVNIDARAASATPEELMVMLIDAILDELPKIQSFIADRKLDLKSASVTRAIRVLEGLESALSEDADPTLRKDLIALYHYCGQRIFDASVGNDPSPLDDCRDVLNILRDAWQEMGKRA